MAQRLAPRRVNARLVTTAEVAGATEFPLRHTGINAVDLFVDCRSRVT
ncbi:hypothetical protein OG422_00345 [Streptomyces sp. NBC_01525]|nr:hypothetical protein [Streptomyces benahoarensis]